MSRPALALLALLLLAGPAAGAETLACGKAGYPHADGSTCSAAPGDSYCTDLESCSRFCCCACRFDPENWNEDGACDNLPASASPNNLSRSGTEELRSLAYVSIGGGARGTSAAREGLDRLNAMVPQLRARYPQYGRFTVRVNSCWRGAQKETEAVCGMVIRKLHIEQSPKQTEAQKQSWRDNAKAIWGLVWPGATPHSGGFACDMVLVDERGQDCFGWRVTDKDPGPTCSIDQRTASGIMDELATSPSVGAVRLNYETWHYEWNSPYNFCRCRGKDDCAKYWPPKGDNNCSPR